MNSDSVDRKVKAKGVDSLQCGASYKIYKHGIVDPRCPQKETSIFFAMWVVSDNRAIRLDAIVARRELGIFHVHASGGRDPFGPISIRGASSTFISSRGGGGGEEADGALQNGMDRGTWPPRWRCSGVRLGGTMYRRYRRSYLLQEHPLW